MKLVIILLLVASLAHADDKPWAAGVAQAGLRDGDVGARPRAGQGTGAVPGGVYLNQPHSVLEHAPLIVPTGTGAVATWQW